MKELVVVTAGCAISYGVLWAYERVGARPSARLE